MLNNHQLLFKELFKIFFLNFQMTTLLKGLFSIILKSPSLPVKNPNWLEWNQLAIYKEWWFSPWNYWGQIHSVVRVGDLSPGLSHLNPKLWPLSMLHLIRATNTVIQLWAAYYTILIISLLWLYSTSSCLIMHPPKIWESNI